MLREIPCADSGGQVIGTKRNTILCASLAGLLTSAKSLAVSGFSFEAGLAQPSLRWLETLPGSINQSVRVTTAGRSDLSQASHVLKLLGESGLHPFIEARARLRNKTMLANSVRNGNAVGFYLGGIKIRGFSIAATKTHGDKLFVTGNLPVIEQDQAEFALQDLGAWPSLAISLDVAVSSVLPGNGELAAEISRSVVGEKVFFATDSQLTPAWRFEIQLKELPYEVISNEQEMLEFTPLFFDATEASARVYSSNKRDGQLDDVFFSITSGQSNLENAFLKTVLDYPGQTRASANSDSKFDFDQNSHQFREANVFAHAASHVEYLAANGYQWNGSSAITLRIAECYNSSCNCQEGAACSDKSNAVYIPWDDAFDSPAIRVAEGDGVLLQDLHLDSGVVRHEFGHHVVFSAITSYQRGSEALQLHEGLADFFVMMHADNPCLGGGICPDTQASICYTNQCLRTAENDLSYGSMDFRSAADHQKGQLISGFLWDLKLAGISRADLVRLVLGAIDLLPQSATFADFTAAIVTANANLAGGTNADLIEQKIIARGLDAAVKSATSSTSSSRRSKSSNVFGCTMRAVAATTETAGSIVSAVDDEPGNPMTLGIFVHDSAGLATTKNNPFAFDLFFWVLLALPLLSSLRLIKSRLKRNRSHIS